MHPDFGYMESKGKEHKGEEHEQENLDLGSQERRGSNKNAADVIKESAMIETKKTETLDIKIKTTLENPYTTAPVIGYFPSGYDPLKLGSDPTVKIYREERPRNPKKPRMQVVVQPSETNKVTFVGTNYSGEAAMPRLCNYALGVLDKETGVLRMVPIAANTVFRLEPIIGGSKLPEKKHVDETKSELTEEERNEKLKALTVKYSTRKNIRRDEKREALRQAQEGFTTEEDMNLQLNYVPVNKEALEAIASIDPNPPKIQTSKRKRRRYGRSSESG